MNKDRVRNVLIDIITNKLSSAINEIKVSDTKRMVKYIEIADDYNIFELMDKISLISEEYKIDKKDILITSVCDVGSYESSSSLNVSFDVIVKRSEKEMQTELKERIQKCAYKLVYKEMIAAGFNRVGFNSSYLRKFEDTSVAEMIQSKEYERLVDYYSLYFDEKSQQ